MISKTTMKMTCLKFRPTKDMEKKKQKKKKKTKAWTTQWNQISSLIESALSSPQKMGRDGTLFRFYLPSSIIEDR